MECNHKECQECGKVFEGERWAIDRCGGKKAVFCQLYCLEIFIREGQHREYFSSSINNCTFKH